MGLEWSLQEAIEYYKGQNAPQNQQALVELLREVQDRNDGVIPVTALSEIAGALMLKDTFLTAIIKRYPSLHTEDAPHTLDLCSGERCQNRGCRELHRFLEETYQVKNGGVSRQGGFHFKKTGCMKHCHQGPNLRWDGILYTGADITLVQKLIEGCTRKKK